MSDARRLVLIGSVFAFLSVLIGAFGAHYMKERLEATGLRSVFETGVHYQMFHALAILMLAAFSERIVPLKKLTHVAYCFAVGTIIFSGSLYALALTNVKILGAVTPFGGLSFMLGWVLLAAAAAKREA